MPRWLVLQSAGLPEIFAVRKIEDRDYYDGGLVDKNPVLPVARTKNTIVIAIALSSDVTKKQLLANRLENERRLREAPAKTTELHLLQPLEAAQVYESSFGLIAIIPSHDLGNFLRGTLGFYARRARALMQLGYSDTYRALAKEDAISELEARATVAPDTSPVFPVGVEDPSPGQSSPSASAN
jgi:predicted acylesterase/phospholipase RssA